MRQRADSAMCAAKEFGRRGAGQSPWHDRLAIARDARGRARMTCLLGYLRTQPHPSRAPELVGRPASTKGPRLPNLIGKTHGPKSWARLVGLTRGPDLWGPARQGPALARIGRPTRGPDPIRPEKRVCSCRNQQADSWARLMGPTRGPNS